MLELVVALTVMGVLAAFVAARFNGQRQRFAMTAALSSLHAFDRAAEMYLAEYQALPRDRNQGVYPAEFASYISQTTWNKLPAFQGALWDWNGPSASPWTTHGACFSIFINPRPAGLWEAFDARHDNNNLSTGSLRLLNSSRNYCLMRN